MAGTMAQKYSRLILSIVVLVLCVTTTIAFAPVSPTGIIKERISTAAKTSISRSTTASCTSTTCLSERRWNFNEGQSPWGMKQNAEVWNGRVAQIAFVWIFLQELVTGKGIFKGIDEGDFFFLVNAGLFGALVVGFTGFLALKGDDDYTKD